MKKTETLRGVVRRVKFVNEQTHWMSGVLQLEEDGSTVNFAGKVVGGPGDTLELTGEWIVHPTYGRQFEVETGVVHMDESPEALAHLLATRSEFVGIGPARARKVVEAALALSDDGDITSSLNDYPLVIAERAGVAEDLVLEARRVWMERRDYFDALARLVSVGWSSAQSAAIVEVFGDNSPTIVASDPYHLIGIVPRFGFKTVDAVARKMGVKSTDPKRLLSGVVYCIDRISQNGHTWTSREDILHESMQELRPDTLEGDELIATALNDLIASGMVFVTQSPPMKDKPTGIEIVASASIARAEFQVFEILMKGLAESPPDRINLTSEASMFAISMLNKGQRAAVEGFSKFRFGVMTGGAGVGKTYTTNAICTVAEENQLRVALCAPTGKAARKLQRASGRAAQTIHRLLEPKYDSSTGGFRFTRNSENPLNVDLIIVDETSMVDVLLMRSLLSAVHPETRVLFVGDHHQIPSVGPGAILRDLLTARSKLGESIHVLTEIVRQAGDLARNTSAILDGVIDPRQSPVWGIQRTERGSEDESASLAASLVEAIVTATDPAPFNRNLDAAWDIQVLAPMRKGPMGTYALNVYLQKFRQRMLGNPAPEETPKGRAPKPLVGDRVIWTKNDYKLHLLNGTQARVISLNKGGSMDIQTEDGVVVTIPPSGRKNVEVSYAMTIHKSQGSEWPCVILVISSTHHIMRDRNLLYTGAGRAAESLTILGDMSGIRSFASYRRSAKRQTFGSFLVHGWSL